MSQTGSQVLSVFHIRTVAGKKSACRHLSERKELDTAGLDLIFCFLTDELGQDNQLE